jgi:hypothetical protein
MAMVMKHLGLPIPRFIRTHDVMARCSDSGGEGVRVHVTGRDGRRLPFVHAITVAEQGQLGTPSAVRSVTQPFVFAFSQVSGWDFQVELAPEVVAKGEPWTSAPHQ